MNKRHINAQLCRVFDKFLKTIKDEDVRNLVEQGTIITGGALVSLLQGEEPHDFDLYFKDFNTAFKVACYYVEQWNSIKDNRTARVLIQNADEKILQKWICPEIAQEQIMQGLLPRIKVFIKSEGVAGEALEDSEDSNPNDEMQTNINPETDIEKELEETPEFIPKFLTSNAISLSGKIQLVIRFYGMPNQIHENYDFVHCTNYWTSMSRSVILNERALEAIINKELIYVGSKYPLCSVIRTRKFIQRGWTINAGQYLKMLMQLNDLDLSNINVLEDQLVGVDSLYFGQLIEELKRMRKENTTFEVESNYVAQIVDKLF
jgi:hypothetical protein